MIRSFHLRDSRLVARLQQTGTPLDVEERLTHPRSPLRSVLLDSIFAPHAGPSTFILDQQDENGKLLGLAQMRTRPGRPERDVVFIAPSLDTGNGSHAIWQRLLAHLCVQTAEHGSLRLYARLPQQSEELQLFRTVGFQEYGQEEVFQLKPGVDRSDGEVTLKLRRQEPGDSWGLQRLYEVQAPRAIQNAEGLAQSQWALAHRRWGEQGRRAGYVWEFDGELMAALHVRAGKRGYWIRTLIHPDALDQVEDLGKAALRLTAARDHLPVYFAYRHYESGWSHILPNLGFQPLLSQIMVVKHVVVRVRKTALALVPALEKSQPEGVASSLVSPSGVVNLERPAGDPPRRQGQNKLVSFL